MSDSVRLLDVQAIEDLQTALCVHRERLQEVLTQAEEAIRKAGLRAEQAAQVLRSRIRRLEDDVYAAQQTLARKQLRKVAGRKPDCYLEERELRRAKQRLEVAKDRLAALRQWQAAWEQALDDYRGPAQRLRYEAEVHLEHARAFLQEKIKNLRDYLEEAPAFGDKKSVSEGGQPT